MTRRLLNYQIATKLGSSIYADVYKVFTPKTTSQHHSEFFVLKKIKSAFYHKELAHYLTQQIDCLAALHLPDVILPHLINHQNNLYLIQPWQANLSLRQWINNQPYLRLDKVIHIILLIAEQLEQRHRAGHIHKNIKPNNILFVDNHTNIQLIDDINVIDMNEMSHFIYQQDFHVESLPYLSPEQTGRIKHSIDYTSDIYSLGIVFFECLTGKPPFLFDDPIAIIHSHLAEIPYSVQSINPDIPEIINHIIQLLLEKAPEKRYQTANGLIVDLKQCLNEWTVHAHIHQFTLKQHDFSHRITIPSLMVGRETEKQSLLSEYKQTAAGLFRASFISGLSGIGKTRLIQELQLPIIQYKGYFGSGKFDQFKKHIPYSALIQALSQLVKLFLTEDDQRIHYWRDNIQTQLGENGQLMVDLVPKLALIIGPQKAVVDLPPIEARNRFNHIVGRFIASLASKQHPLTLFIDDLQWCDSATFELLQGIFNNAEDFPYLYLLGAYRNNEVNSTHRLTLLINHIKKNQRTLTEIHLNALTVSDVNQMTAYILNTYPSRTSDLAHIIYQTSLGNPLFVNEALHWLYTYKHLHLSEQGIWVWDDQQLRHSQIPDTALDLFKDKIAKHPQTLRDLLAISSCLGSRFNTADLALVTNQPLAKLLQQLSLLFADNILVRDKEQLYFFHDQVQAAAASFLNQSQKQRTHLNIARALIGAIDTQTSPERLPNLFAIVEHLALGRETTQTHPQKQQESQFNYHAGIVAMQALAMENANFFFRQSLELLPYYSWQDDYDFLFLLHKYLARTEMALGHQPASEHILSTLIKESKNDLDRVDCLYEQTKGLSSMGRFKLAIDLGNQGLHFFNRAIPANDTLALKKAEQIIQQIHDGDTDIWQQILDTVPSTERATQIETGIYSELIPDYYLAGMVPQLYLSAIQSTQNCLTGGVDETVIYGFSMVGLYLQRRGQYQMSFKYEDLGLALSERYPDTFGATKGINGILWTNMHNRRESDYIIEQCQKNIHRGQTCGDLYNAGLSYGPYIWHLITQGLNLNEISKVANHCIHFSNKFHLSLSLGLAESALLGWSHLMSTPQSNAHLIEQKLQQWENDKHIVSIGGYFTLKGISLHYLGDYNASQHALNQAEPYLRGLSDNILNRLWYVFQFVNGLRLNHPIEPLTNYFNQVQIWVNLGDILTPYFIWMQMEQASYQQDFSHSRQHALDAIDRCTDKQFTLLSAYLHERLGQLLQQKHHSQTRDYLNKAITLYQQCAAHTKTQQLQQHYAALLVETTDKQLPLTQQLDINYLHKATKNITQQLDLNRLLSTIIQAVMERLGAKTAYLLIANDTGLEVVARGDKTDQVTITIKTPARSLAVETLSMAVVNYVYRTTQLLVIENACSQGDFISDSTVQTQQLKSILCIPLRLKQQILGILYLENNLIESIFTHQQIEMVRLLTAQAAIALQNTQLVDEMKRYQAEIELLNKTLEQRVQERTAKLNLVNEELSHFSYVISHDLKAPLRAINQLTEWVTDDYDALFDDEGKQKMALIKGRAKRMYEMIDGILQYSRIGRIRTELESIDLNQLIQEVIQLIAPPTHIQITIENHFPIITGEKHSLHQVFQNLIDNAIKYNDKPIGIIQLTCQDLIDVWQISIQDNGIGIAEKYQDKIFQLFQTLKLKDDYESTGVGLSIIEKSITHWGGKIWLKSTEGQGCQFIFTIPKIISSPAIETHLHL